MLFFVARKLLKWGVLLLIACALVVYFCNLWISKSTANQIYDQVEELPFNAVALLPGARPGNLYYSNRIKAAAALYHAGKIKTIIVSGDNHIKEYDEATAMFTDLVKEGIPDSCIYIDYAGFRTLDSVVRCDKIFGQKKFVVISQRFHNERALFIANHKDFQAIAFCAKDVPEKWHIGTKWREYFARVKCVLDLYVLRTEPKYLGEKVIIKN